MWRKTLTLALAAVAILAASLPRSPAITDLTGDYTRFFDATQNMPQAERVRRFKALMTTRFPGFYDGKRAGGSQVGYDGRITKSFAQFPSIRAKFVASAAALGPQLASAQAAFRRTFTDAGALPPTYLVHSLGEMDGGTREIGGKTVLVFGADVIALAHRAGSNERPFFEHEIFHTYHEPRLGECKPLWCSVWAEGLATYVAARLNPGATDDELLLTGGMRQAVEANRTASICAVRVRALSENDEDYSALFTGSHHLPGFHDRIGYYVGYLVAKRIGDGHPLSEPANWKAQTARPRVLAALTELAPDCPSLPT